MENKVYAVTLNTPQRLDISIEVVDGAMLIRGLNPEGLQMKKGGKLLLNIQPSGSATVNINFDPPIG